MMSTSQPKMMPSALEKAVKHNDLNKVKSILADKKFQQTEWLNAVNKRGRTAILLALKYKCLSIVDYLLSLPGTHLHLYDPYGYSLLYLSWEFPEIFLKILNDPRTPIPKDKTASGLLVDSIRRNNNIEIMRAMLAKGVNVNCKYGGDATILWWAVVEEKTEFVRLLLQQVGVDVNCHYPLLEAAMRGNIDILTLLLNHPNINVNIKSCIYGDIFECIDNHRSEHDHRGRLLCSKAVLSHPRLDAKWLQHSGCPMLPWLKNINSTLYTKIINLDSTLIERRREENRLRISISMVDVVKVLIADPNFNLNQMLWNYQTLLTLAVSGDHGILNMLLDCSMVNLHQQDTFGHTVLTQAEGMGRTDLHDVLLKHPRFNLSVTYRHKQNLLMLAAKKGCTYLITRLLDQGIFPVNAIDDEGNSALILLAKHHNKPDDARLFIEFLRHGADPIQRNNKSINAIMAAENSELKGIAMDLKNFTPPTQQPPTGTAPPMDVELQASLAEAASQPLSCSQSRFFATDHAKAVTQQMYPTNTLH